MTLAVVPAVYVLPTPGVNAPNAAGVPSESDSVAGTVPPTVPPVTSLEPSRTCIQLLSSCALASSFAREAASPRGRGPGASVRSASMSVSDELYLPWVERRSTCRTRSGPAPCPAVAASAVIPPEACSERQQRLDLDVRDAVGVLHAGRGEDALVDALAEPRRGPVELPVVAEDLRPLAAAVVVRAPGDRVIAALDVARVGADADRADVGASLSVMQRRGWTGAACGRSGRARRRPRRFVGLPDGGRRRMRRVLGVDARPSSTSRSRCRSRSALAGCDDEQAAEEVLVPERATRPVVQRVVGGVQRDVAAAVVDVALERGLLVDDRAVLHRVGGVERRCCRPTSRR